MGCCAGLRSDMIMDKGIIVNMEPKEKMDFIVSKIEDSEEKDRISKNDTVKKGKISSKTVETNNTDNLSQPKSRKKVINPHERRVRHTAKNLKKISISEVENTHKFFVVN
jgi:hypothetical protein